ncbi:efflux RND transporter periplasmic adaptor subunit [Marinomonas mediterranea]|uniref:efflux RND transporter periplasmic adaptor subunit n=1 Tax=Marinomonas mediterranea TaxID=119864 RepID=UPI00234A4DE2|nr:efflux RND transporter periplasmic adaptor subunit [Marinomonas mediterranea]WCN09030.1 efflux RND transporter periplasmic adaptor subunit [Marinomonas mediterranea]WCN13064.1 efflux RND transporter periplasmic adaptor subunit [Marinomonas mediterranea]
MKYITQWAVLCLALVIAAGSYWYINDALQDESGSTAFLGEGGGPRPGKGPGGPKGEPGGGSRRGESAQTGKQQSVRANEQESEKAIVLSVVTVSPSSYAPTINATGLVKPRYDLTLTSKVSGEVTHISSHFELGKRVEKGDELIRLSNKELNSAVADARKTLASAELALKEEERQGEQAQAEWKAAGFAGKPDSDLVLRKPQLADAKATVNAAKASLSEAIDDLKHTKITAPFDALVVSQDVTPGANISANGELATLYSTDRAEISLNLSSSDWVKLPDTKTLLVSNWPALITSIDSDIRWDGSVIAASQHIDTSTRMRSLTIGLMSPLDQAQPLLPGAFVSVSLKGKQIDQLWKLPSTALSQQSEIWYLDDENRLNAFEVTPLFSDSDSIYIPVPIAFLEQPYHVLVKPFSSYLKGMLAKPAEVNE